MFTYFKNLSLNKNATSASSALAVTSMILFTAACSQPESFVKNKVDNFNIDTIDNYTQASSLIQADYLISVDFSYSMSGGCITNCQNSKTSRLFGSLDSFAESLKASEIDYRIGFVRGSKQSTTNIADSDFISGLVITSAFNSSLTALIRSRLGAVGKPLEGNVTSVVETSAKVLSKRGYEFMRESAQLVLLFVSDTDDAEFTDTHVNQIRAMKNDASYISARAVLTGIGDNCYTDNEIPAGNDVAGYNENAWGEKKGLQIIKAVNQLDTVSPGKTACILNNFSSIMNDVARTISRQTKRFKLQVPNPDISTLEVIAADRVVPTTDYIYERSTNEIVFANTKEPAPKASLVLKYEQNYVLSSTPDSSTLEVQVNGTTVSQNSSNGWTYDSASNRIVFHGAAKPANGAKMQVMYKLGNG